MLKFAHLADCHLGCWRTPELQELSTMAFKHAIDECIKEKVDFVLIAGDLFDNSSPPIEILKEAAYELNRLKESKIECYVIPGSHDFSVSGKTFLDVFEKAKLFTNVARYEETEDEVKLELFKKNGVILAGIPGKKAGLETRMIEKIKDKAEGNDLKILALHTTLTEAKPRYLEMMDSVDSENLPKGFDYYAFGHLHEYFNKNINGKSMVYPGPLFPANFQEFEELGNGSFCIVKWDGKIEVEKRNVKLKDVERIKIDANNKTPEQIMNEISQGVSRLSNKIIILKVKGTLSRGKTSDLDFEKITEAVEKNRNILLRNTNALKSPEFRADVDAEGKDIEQIEKEVVEKYGRTEEYKDFSGFIESIMHSLETEKREGETNSSFEKRITDDVSKVLGI